MSVFITLTTDAFAENFRITSNNKADTHRAGIERARRPLRGIEIKDDTFAYMKLIRSDGSEIPLVDSGSPDGENTQFSNFLLQSVSEARMEKHQLVETFGEPYIYFFGESPRFLDVQAILIDSLDFNWYAEFWENYNKYLRGTRSVELGARTYLFYNDNVVEGYILMAQAQQVSDTPWQARLSFRMYLTNYTNVTFVGDASYPVRANVNLPRSVDLTTSDAFDVGQAAVTAAGQAALDEARSIQAATGARQQAGGFGGGQKLADAIRGGVSPSGDPSIDGIIQNAQQALANSAGLGARGAPLRGLIADNVDEFTAMIPPPPGNDPAMDHDGQAEAEDFPTTATAEANKYGADINNPNTYSRMGFGPYFPVQQGFGLGGGAMRGASFGVSSVGLKGAGFRGGINGGLGFTGVFSASATRGVPTNTSPFGAAPFNTASPLNTSPFGVPPFDPRANALSPYNPALSSQQTLFREDVFGNGVVVAQGVVQGTGIGGGIPGGVAGGVGPNGPGTLPQFAGGQMFVTPNGFNGLQGYGTGLSANGAVLNVPGAPTAFSTCAVPGTLYPNGIPPNGPPPLGTATGVLFIGPDGVSSKTNTTGIFT